MSTHHVHTTELEVVHTCMHACMHAHTHTHTHTHTEYKKELKPMTYAYFTCQFHTVYVTVNNMPV